MKEVNRDNLNFADFSLGKKEKEARLWNLIYNIFKVLGLAGLITTLAFLGFTATSAVIAACIAVCIGGVAIGKVIPTKNTLSEENTKKVDFMIELAEKGVTVDSEEFELTQVSSYDDRKAALIDMVKPTENGNLEKKREVFGRLGNVYTYYYFKDSNDTDQLLVSDEEFYEDKRLLGNENGYVSRISSRMSYGLLEEEDLNALPEVVRVDVKSYMREQADINVRIKRR